MIRNGYEFLDWLHQIRAEDTERLKGLSSREYVDLINREGEAVWERHGYKAVPAADGRSRMIVKIEES